MSKHHYLSWIIHTDKDTRRHVLHDPATWCPKLFVAPLLFSTTLLHSWHSRNLHLQQNMPQNSDISVFLPLGSWWEKLAIVLLACHTQGRNWNITAWIMALNRRRRMCADGRIIFMSSSAALYFLYSSFVDAPRVSAEEASFSALAVGRIYRSRAWSVEEAFYIMYMFWLLYY